MALYQVGRPAVREAMQNLQRMGLVHIRHGERARVAMPSLTRAVAELGDTINQVLLHSEGSLDHLKEARLLFEIEMARIAARRRTPRTSRSSARRSRSRPEPSSPRPSSQRSTAGFTTRSRSSAATRSSPPSARPSSAGSRTPRPCGAEPGPRGRHPAGAPPDPRRDRGRQRGPRRRRDARPPQPRQRALPRPPRRPPGRRPSLSEPSRFTACLDAYMLGVAARCLEEPDAADLLPISLRGDPHRRRGCHGGLSLALDLRRGARFCRYQPSYSLHVGW